MTATLSPELVASIVQGGLVALVGFLLRRSIRGLDDSLKEIKADLRLLDTTDREQGRQILELNIQVKYLQLESRELKDAMARTDERHEEFGRFLQSQGFRRSGVHGE